MFSDTLRSVIPRCRLLPGRRGLLALLGGACAAPLAAQQPSLSRLGFLNGCWEAPVTEQGRPGILEERYTTPTANNMLGTTRFVVNGNTIRFAFTVIRSDSNGVFLASFPGGVRAPDELRLTRAQGDSAVFEGLSNRLLYHRSPDGRLTIEAGAGPGDVNRRTLSLATTSCAPSQPMAAQPGTAPQGPDRSGRVLLYVTQTLNGLYLGFAIPAAAGAEGAGTYGLGLIAGPAVGLLFAKALNDAGPVSLGQATAITWGGWWGLWNGIALTEVLDDNADTEDFLGHSVVGLIAGTTAGMLLARRPIQAGDASLAAHASVWGSWYGAVASVLVDDDALPYMLVGGNAALLSAMAGSKGVNMSAGRVWVVTAAGIAGLVAGLGLDLLAQVDDEKTAIIIPAITSFAGLATGMTLTRDFDRQRMGALEGGSGALLAMRGGRLELGLPQPQPALVPREERDGRRRWVPGVRLTLLDLRH